MNGATTRSLQGLLGCLALSAGLACSRNGGSGLHSGAPGTPAVDPTLLDFGRLPVGQQALARFTVTNVGDYPLTVVSVSATGDFAVAVPLAVSDAGSSFGETPDSGLPDSGRTGAAVALDPFGGSAASSAALILAFTPTATGLRSGSLKVATVDSQGNTGTATADVTGTGVDDLSVALLVSPQLLPFGATQSLHRATKTLHVSNPNPFPVQVYLSAPAAGDGGPDFSADFTVPTFGPGLLPNQATDLQLSFIPAGSETAIAVTQVAACPGCPATAVTLTGNGVDSALTFDPPAVDFGFVVNNPSPVPSVKVTATLRGDVAAQVSSAAPPGAPFALTNFAPTELPVLLSPDGGTQQFSFDVTYQPTGVFGGDAVQFAFPYALSMGGTKTAYLPVVGNQSFAPCQLQLQPAGQLDFHALPPGASASRTVSIINVGANDCFAAGFSLADPVDDGFALGAAADAGTPSGPDGGPFVVLAHGSLDIELTFNAPLNAVKTRHQTTLRVVAPGQGADGLSAVLLGEVSTPYASGSPWPKVHHDNANSGLGELEAPGFDGGLLWRAALNPAIAARLPSCTPGLGAYQGNGPVLGAQNRVYQLGCDGVLHEFDALSGAQNRFLPLPAPDEGQLITPTVAASGTLALAYASDAGLVGFAASDGGALAGNSLFFVDLASFTLQSAAAGPQLLGAGAPSPVLQGPTLTWAGLALYDFAPSYNQVSGLPLDLTRLDALQLGYLQHEHDFRDTGTVTLSTLVSTGPAVDGQNRSYWCSEGDCVAAGPNLEILWSRSGLTGPGDLGQSGESAGSHGSPVLAAGSLFYQSFWVGPDSSPGTAPYPYFRSTLFALDPADGHTRWSVELPKLRAPVGPAAATNPFLTLRGTHLPLGPALAPDGTLILPYADGLYRFASSGPGNPLWRVPIAGGVASTPVVSADGTVFSASLSAGLVAIDLSNGALRPGFAPKAGGRTVSVTSVPAIGPSAIYFAADDGFLYAVH